MTRLKPAFITEGDPRNADLLSGTPHNMMCALERHADMVEVVSQPVARRIWRLGQKVRHRSGQRIDPAYVGWFVRLALRTTIRRLRAIGPDAVFAPVCSPLSSRMVGDFAIVHASDATPRVMRGYYDAFTDLRDNVFARIDATERTLLRGALLACYPSEWAGRSAIEDYGIAPDRVVTIPWGANLDTLPEVPQREAPPNGVRLLFVGKEWQRKGGDIALGATERLRDRGIEAQIDVVGCGAEVFAGSVPSHIRFHGRLDKRRETDARLLEMLYVEADLFILPTRAECYGIVFAEAAHHALPSIGYATGGTPSVVQNGRTGILLPLSAGAEDFASEIARLIGDEARYRAMSRDALQDARERLVWDIWARRVVDAIAGKLDRDHG